MGLQTPKDVRCYKHLVPTALKQTASAECLDQMVRPESLQMSKLQSHKAFMTGLTLYMLQSTPRQRLLRDGLYLDACDARARRQRHIDA